MKIGNMTAVQAQEINTWTYEEPYDLYSFSGAEEDMNELLDGSYFSCCDHKGELLGYFCYGKTAQVPGGWKAKLYNEDALDIGLGMKPSLVGNGLGKEFLLNGLAFGEKTFNPKSFRLSVATFNKRAIALYKNLGFEEGKIFYSNKIEFIIMNRKKFDI